MRCVRCHGLMTRDETRSIDNDFLQVDGMRCINCGCFCPTEEPNLKMSHPRFSSRPALLANERRRRSSTA